MPLTPREKVRIKFHLNYPVQSNLRSMQAGLPTVVESNWQIEATLQSPLEEETIDVVRDCLSQLEDILFRDFPDARLEHKAEQLEELRLNMKHTTMLAQDYQMWQGQLAKALCVPVNPDQTGVGGNYSSVRNFEVG